MSRFSAIAFEGREIEGPYSGETIRNLVPASVQSVLDVGCGKGALLRLFGLPGVGVDLSAESIDYARAHVPGCEFHAGPAKEVIPSLAIRPDLIVNMGASQAIGSQLEALAYFADMLAPGKFLLFGDGVWDAEPPQSYLDFLGAKRDDLGTFSDLCVTGLPFGLRATGSYHSTQDDWDSFEDHYYSTMIRWCDANPTDPDSDAFRSRMTLWRETYLSEGRGTLGFATVLFERF